MTASVRGLVTRIELKAASFDQCTFDKSLQMVESTALFFCLIYIPIAEGCMNIAIFVIVSSYNLFTEI